MRQQQSLLNERFPKTEYLEFGWGDEGFYQAKEITAGLIMQAVFWPTASVMHVVAVLDDVTGYFQHSEVLHLCLTEQQLASLTDFIAPQFRL